MSREEIGTGSTKKYNKSLIIIKDLLMIKDQNNVQTSISQLNL